MNKIIRIIIVTVFTLVIVLSSISIYFSVKAKNHYDKGRDVIGDAWELNENNNLNESIDSITTNHIKKNDFIYEIFDVIVPLGYSRDLDGYIRAIYLDKIKPYSYFDVDRVKREAIRMQLIGQCMMPSVNGNVIDVVRKSDKVIIARFQYTKQIEIIMVQNSNETITEFWVVKDPSEKAPTAPFKGEQ